MSRRVFCWLSAALTFALTAAPLFAHHGISVKFDPDAPITLEGRVTRLDWSNPHVHVYMIVDDGTETRPWYVELESPLILEQSGWESDALKPGDSIRVEGIAARDGSPQVWGNSVLIAATGREVLKASAAIPGPDARSGRPTPRWPDGQARLGPPPNESGYWVPTSTVMMEDGANVEMDANGLLDDIADAGRVAPFQEWARALYESRQRSFLQFDPMFLECRPPAGPRQFQVPFGIQFVEDRDFRRIFVLAGGGNRDWHLIYTDGRAHDGGFDIDDGNFLYYGRAVARWEDDTLIIDSRGFNERFWFSNGGLPHTSELQLIERISRPDFDTLTYEVTVNDPGAYTRPWTSSWTLRWVADADPPEYYCQDNRP